MATTHPQVRMTLIRDFQKELFTTPRRFLFKERVEIIQHNSKLCGNTRQTLSFNNSVYAYGEQLRGKQPRPNLLQPALRPRFKEYLAEVAKVEEEEQYVLGYIKNVMAHTDCVADFCALLPSALHPIIRNNASMLNSREGKFGEAEISAFLEKNDKYVRMLKSRLLMNVIDVS